MAVPKRKQSNSRTGMRRSHDALKAKQLQACPKCGTPVGNREVAMKRLNDWLRGRPPQAEVTGLFKLGKKKEETPSIICVGCEQ